MTSTSDTGETPESVAALATEKVDLPALALLGVFGRADALAALIRFANGDISRVTAGDTVGRVRIVAIGEDRVALSHSGREEIIAMPDGQAEPSRASQGSVRR